MEKSVWNFEGFTSNLLLEATTVMGKQSPLQPRSEGLYGGVQRHVLVGRVGQAGRRGNTTVTQSSDSLPLKLLLPVRDFRPPTERVQPQFCVNVEKTGDT